VATDRATGLRRAILLSIASLVWSALVGGIAVFEALTSGSLSLLGFGITALIDASASVALIWRFASETGDPRQADLVERRAERAIGSALLLLAAYLLISSARALISGDHPAADPVGVTLLLSSLAVQPLLGLLKRRVGREIESPALLADGLLSFIGGGLAGVGLVGLVAATLYGLLWADAVAASVVAVVAAREGLESLRLSRPGPASIKRERRARR
jgi:divalent metal cation (Fe/Co/Zn/Cd) transporter